MTETLQDGAGDPGLPRASGPRNDAGGTAEQVVLIPLAEIEVGERLRPVDPDWVATLAAWIARDGQLQPIDVCRLPGRSTYRLVFGAHRLAALQRLGRTHVAAFVRGADALGRRSRELTENLMRRELEPLDRAAFVAELLEVERERAGLAPDETGRTVLNRTRALKSEAKNQSAKIALWFDLTDEAANKAGLSRRSIFYALELHRQLVPQAAALVRETPVGRNASQLRALAALPPSEQVAAAERLAAGAAKTVAAAAGKAPAAQSPEERRFGAFRRAWEAMSAPERAAALGWLAEQDWPAGYVTDGTGLPRRSAPRNDALRQAQGEEEPDVIDVLARKAAHG